MNRDVIRRKQLASPLGPLDQDQRVRGENVIPTQIRELVGATKAIQIEVIDRRARRGEFVDQREGRTRDVVRHPVPVAYRARQRGLPRAELAAEGDDEWRTRRAPKSLAPR